MSDDVVVDALDDHGGTVAERFREINFGVAPLAK
jgi:hypothetical protein